MNYSGLTQTLSTQGGLSQGCNQYQNWCPYQYSYPNYTITYESTCAGLHIEKVANGFTVKGIDGTQDVYVFNDFADMVKLLKEKLK